MELKQVIKSEVDNSIKYIFEVYGQIVEYSYIDNGSGKDIICVPCQTMCNMSCAFCHLTDHIGTIPMKNLSGFKIMKGAKYIYDDLGLGNRPLLISFMGCGEPLANLEGVVEAMTYMRTLFKKVRFGLATMIPKKFWSEFILLTNFAVIRNLPLKVHLSLHFVDDEQREKWMPSALDIKQSVELLDLYHQLTGNPIEVHYTIMDGINDSEEDIGKLHRLLHKDCTIKFMMYSERDSLSAKRASKARISKSIHYLEGLGYTAEYYEPPGNDIGASCGQFLTQYTNERAKQTEGDFSEAGNA